MELLLDGPLADEEARSNWRESMGKKDMGGGSEERKMSNVRREISWREQKWKQRRDDNKGKRLRRGPRAVIHRNGCRGKNKKEMRKDGIKEEIYEREDIRYRKNTNRQR